MLNVSTAVNTAVGVSMALDDAQLMLMPFKIVAGLLITVCFMSVVLSMIRR